MKFNITSEVISVGEAIDKASSNKSLLNNFVRIENYDKESETDYKDSGGSNSILLNVRDVYEGSTTAAHEFGHSLGMWFHGTFKGSPDYAEVAGQPGIMTTIHNIVGAEYTENPVLGKSVNDIVGKQIINPLNTDKRRVTQTDIDNIYGLKTVVDNKGGGVGSLSNRIYNKPPLKP